MMILRNLLTFVANKQQKTLFASVMNGLQSTEASSWNYCMLLLDWTGNWEGDYLRLFLTIDLSKLFFYKNYLILVLILY